MKTYCVDLDGTLCATAGLNYMGAVPIRDRIDRVNALYAAGHRILIDTARGSDSGEDWHDRTARQLARWGVQYHVLRCGVKFAADEYIDDRATNAGDW